MNISQLYYIAASYDCNAYGAGSFNNSTCSTSTGNNDSTVGGGSAGGGSATTGQAGSATTKPGDFLADTGYAVILPVALAGAVLIAAAILLVKRLARRHQA